MLAKEMSECTFRPVINEVPSYVKCMASAQKRLKENSAYKKQVCMCMCMCLHRALEEEKWEVLSPMYL